MSEYYITRSDPKRKQICYGTTRFAAYELFVSIISDIMWELYGKAGTVTLKLYEKGVKKPISEVRIKK